MADEEFHLLSFRPRRGCADGEETDASALQVKAARLITRVDRSAMTVSAHGVKVAAFNQTTCTTSDSALPPHQKFQLQVTAVYLDKRGSGVEAVKMAGLEAQSAPSGCNGA